MRYPLIISITILQAFFFSSQQLCLFLPEKGKSEKPPQPTKTGRQTDKIADLLLTKEREKERKKEIITGKLNSSSIFPISGNAIHFFFS